MLQNILYWYTSFLADPWQQQQHVEGFFMRIILITYYGSLKIRTKRSFIIDLASLLRFLIVFTSPSSVLPTLTVLWLNELQGTMDENCGTYSSKIAHSWLFWLTFWKLQYSVEFHFVWNWSGFPWRRQQYFGPLAIFIKLVTLQVNTTHPASHIRIFMRRHLENSKVILWNPHF